MKKITRIIAGVIAVVALAALVSCSEKENQTGTQTLDGLIAIQPEYVGETVTDTQHEFKKSDFKVTAVFKGNVSRLIEDYTFEVKGMAQGIYLVDFYYYDQENELYVPIDMNFYPTDRETYED